MYAYGVYCGPLNAPIAKPIAVVEEVEPQDQAPAQEVAAAPEPKSAPEQKSRNSGMADESARYGESLLRQMLGAEPMQDKNGK